MALLNNDDKAALVKREQIGWNRGLTPVPMSVSLT